MSSGKTTQRIGVELEAETLRALAGLGNPSEVLAKLAQAAADSVRRECHTQRGHTDESLRVERGKADVVIARQRNAVDDAADQVVRIARERADQVVLAARDVEGGGRGGELRTSEANSAHERTRAHVLLERERSDADAMLDHERAEHAHDSDRLLEVEREATDRDLTSERAGADTLIDDQREANAQMVNATIQAQELAVEADAAKERAEESEQELRKVAEFREMFIGILGHDLRNPLGSIVMAAALLLRRGHLNGHDAETATRIIRSSQRMTRMITQLLDLTRARLGGGLPIEPKPTDLGAVCRSVVEEFEATIELKVAGDMAGNWDQDRLAEGLSNVVGNAVEYAAPGTTVLVQAYAVGAEAVVEVINQGEPIPADVMPFIFEPFRRATQRPRSAQGNLGLGLYIARQIVISHGGTLDALSAGGTTNFVMRLPRQTP